MRSRGAAIQGGLAALGLVAAYATWQREPERAAGEVVVLDVNKGDLSKVRYDDGTSWVEMTLRKESDGPVIWLKLSANEKAKTPEREVRGNEGALKLWEKLAPLRATRALGTLGPDKLKELGLDGAKKHIEITARGATHKYKAGSPAFNVAEPYVLDEADQRVYVLGGGVLSDLGAAGVRLQDRTLHSFKQNEFDGLTVSSGGKKRELKVTGQQTPASAKLVGKTGKTDDQAKNWHDKLWRLFVTDVLGKGEKPAAGEPPITLRVDYKEGGKDLGFIELGRVSALPPPAPANTSTPPAAPTTEVYGRTEHTAGWVKLPALADDLLKEADKIAAGD
jgi:hypothetical protein